MFFKPKTEKELAEMNIVPNGEYPFEVIGAEDKKSSKNNDMIELKVRFFYDGDRSRILNDYLLEAMAFKLAHFCEATGLMQKYLAGNLEARDCLRKTGVCKVGLDPEKNGYPARNKIVDYVCEENEEEPEVPADNQQPPVEDDVPF